MKFVKTLTLVLLTATSITAVGVGADGPDALIDSYIKAIGGRAAVEKIQTQVTKGTFALPDMGMYAPFEMYLQPPDKSYMSVNFAEVSPASNGVNGEVAWQNNPMTGPQLLSGGDRLSAIRNVAVEPLLNWKKDFAKAEIAGEEAVAGQPCTKVVFTPAEGSELVVYFSNETHLISRMIGEQGGMRSQTDVSDYRETGGVKQPYRLNMSTPQFTFEIQVESIEHNVPIDSAKFALPPDIQSLVNR